ncbi:MAG TPA: Holliday junction branch migration protein RuvA [Phnomibacter sp.]|nr:Holliday junction branch migration protein RuvA [Phnomibacter sp.]
MIAQLTGKFSILTPTLLVLDVQGVGYELHISLHTYTALQGRTEGPVHTYLKVSEDALTLYGFADVEEKEMFIRLIGISGVGAATARMMLSSLRPAEITAYILAGDARQLERVKGIGKKTAERLVLELKDKLGKSTVAAGAINLPAYNTVWNDALEALMALGIQRAPADAAIKKLQMAPPDDPSVEAIIKQVLKTL